MSYTLNRVYKTIGSRWENWIAMLGISMTRHDHHETQRWQSRAGTACLTNSGADA